MGYDLHITRKRDWADEAGPAITPEEWLTIVRNDPELTLGEGNGPYYAVWSGPSKYPEPWIDYFEDGLSSKNPDEPLIDKMVQIAELLGAKVQGDDGEVYPGGGEPPYYEHYEPDTQTVEVGNQAQASSPQASPHWWQRLFKR